MKKLFLFICIVIVQTDMLHAQSSIPDWYKNLEKYWFYRYRLVNDFMLISDEAGGTIPAQKRIRYWSDKNDPIIPDKKKTPNSLDWGQDASTDLGYYIAALATEYEKLQRFGWSTNRTEWELNHAMSAFERLDEYAESYCDNVRTGGGYPGTLTSAQISQFSDRNNGFFIRDDVPFYDFVEKNKQHFNRPAINTQLTKVDSASESSFYERYTGPSPNPNRTIIPKDPTYAAGAPVYPVEESQDQLVAIFYGMALAKDCGVSSYNLQQRLDDKLYKIIAYPFSDPNLKFRIKNPLTNDCVYGVSPDTYPASCNAGGADFILNSRPASSAVNKLVSGSQATILEAKGMANDLIYQALQLKNCDPIKLGGKWNKGAQFILFTDCLSAISRTWVNFWLPWPVNKLANTTWTRVRDHSMSNFFGTPDVPLLYKWFHPHNGVDFCPECHHTPQNLYGWQLPSYDYLLNSAPPCGPYNHNYTYDYADREWSSNNRLCDPFHRKGVGVFGFTEQFDGSNEQYDNADYNGIDYMVLFNLYSHVNSSYLGLMINPYYTENFNTNYPTASSLGSTAHRLKLQYLEYLSAVNKINPDGYVTYRGGKVIDLIPGFEAKYNSNFLAYIQDYSCDEGPFNYAYQKDAPNSDAPTYYQPIVYTPQPIVQQMPYPDDSTYIEDDSSDYYISAYSDSLLLDSLAKYVYGSGDSDLISWYHNMFDTSYNDSSINKLHSDFNNSQLTKSKKQTRYIPTASGYISIYPNPNNGTFTISIPEGGDYDMKVVSIVGVTVYETRLKDERKREIQLEDKLPPGNYTVHLIGKDVNYIEKLVIVK